MIRYGRVALLSAKLELQQLLVEPFVLPMLFLQPLVLAVAGIAMLRHRPDFEAVYVVVGTGLTALFTAALFGGSGAIFQERVLGTLEMIEAAPTPLVVVVAGKMLGMLLVSLSAMALGYGVAVWLFGYPIGIRDPDGFGVSLLLAVLSLWTTALLLAPLAFLWPTVQRLATGLEYPVYILCGFLFPVSVLPGWLQRLSPLLPPYWAARALHGTSSGALTADALLRAWLLLLLSSAVALGLAAWLHQAVLTRLRREARIGAV